MVRVPQIILELNHANAAEEDDRKSAVSIRKLTWDFNEMQYKPECLGKSEGKMERKNYII
jgi:hypothetical protein